MNAGIVRNPSEYMFSSAYDYENDERGELKMELIDFGSKLDMCIRYDRMRYEVEVTNFEQLVVQRSVV